MPSLILALMGVRPTTPGRPTVNEDRVLQRPVRIWPESVWRVLQVHWRVVLVSLPPPPDTLVLEGKVLEDKCSTQK
jgi:hypothetical protein